MVAEEGVNVWVLLYLYPGGYPVADPPPVEVYPDERGAKAGNHALNAGCAVILPPAGDLPRWKRLQLTLAVWAEN